MLFEFAQWPPQQAAVCEVWGGGGSSLSQDPVSCIHVHEVEI